MRPVLAHLRRGVAGVEVEVGPPPAVHPAGAGAGGSNGCIEYAGVKPSAIRPGPPNAWSSCCCTSLEPLAAHTCSTVSPWPR